MGLSREGLLTHDQRAHAFCARRGDRAQRVVGRRRLDRAALATPVWQAFGPEAWARFSDRAAFGTGLTMDSVVAVGAVALMIVAAVGFINRGQKTPFAPSLAVVFSLLGLMFYVQAAQKWHCVSAGRRL